MTDDLARNRDLWTRTNAEYADQEAARQWSQEDVTWGIWGVPDREVRVLPGFEVEDLVEIQAPPDAETHPVYDYVSAEWGRRRPAEEIWVARKR